MLTHIVLWINNFLRADQDPDHFLALIATEIDRTYMANGQYKFFMSDPLLKWGYVSYVTENDQSKTEYLKITIDDNAKIQRSDVEAIWGESWKGIMAPSQPYPSLWFHPIDKPGFKYVGRLIVSIKYDVKDDAYYVVEISVSRQNRN